VYVKPGAGQTADVKHRFTQHINGKGAEWTKLHRPIRLLHVINTGTRDGREAEFMEDEMTLELMSQHGIECVRGGHFSALDQSLVENLLHSKDAWIRVNKAKYDILPFDTEVGWKEALDELLQVAVAFYDNGSPPDQREALFVAVYRLSRYRYWRADFATALSREFWDSKGVLPVILTFKLGRTVGSKLAGPFDVLAAALNRGRNGTHPLRRLFLLAWQTYQPAINDQQATTLARFMTYLDGVTPYDQRFDEFVSVLFPETRHVLRGPRSRYP